MKYSEEIVNIARKMRSDGISYPRIGKALGVSESTARRICTPELSDRERERKRSRYADDPHYRQREVERLRTIRATKPEYSQQQSKRYRAELHPPVTYVIGSPDYADRVIIGTTIHLDKRFGNYKGKSFAPLQCLGVTNIPEKAVHRYFARERIGRSEFFRLTPELQEFIDTVCRFGDGECFTGEGRLAWGRVI